MRPADTRLRRSLLLIRRCDEQSLIGAVHDVVADATTQVVVTALVVPAIVVMTPVVLVVVLAAPAGELVANVMAAVAQ